MIAGSDLVELVKIFRNRSVRLYHACQYADFLSYANLGGIPSRGLLEQNAAQFTPFETDGSDKIKGVWNAVFLNITDFGKAFADQKYGTPNAYGPILLIIRPEALLECAEVAICLRS